MLFQPARDGQRVLAVARDAQGQRLDAVDEEEGVQRRDRRAEVAQGEHARRDGEGEIAEGLAEDHAIVGRVRLRKHRDSGRS